MSRVDVVVPCYNYARYLECCVESVLSQSGVDVRVLIIDDSSPDETPRVGQRLAALDPRVEYRRHDINRGHIATYNEGLLEWASAEYCLLLSADDALAPGSLKRATDLMDANPDIVMAYGMALIVDDGELPGIHPADQGREHRILSGGEFLARCCSYGNPVPTPTAVARTAVQKAIGGYRPFLPHSGDMEMWMRFAAHGSIGVVNSIQAFYRQHGANMGEKAYSQQLSDWREVVQAREEFFAKWGERFPDAGKWMEAGRERICESAFSAACAAFDRGDTEKALICLRYAEEIYPPLRGSNKWLRLQAKLVMGNSFWRKIRPGLDFMRRKFKTGEYAANYRMDPPQKLNGWWPGVR